jgi:hypothetical protein
MGGNVEIKPILNIDIDKYIEWYKDECERSAIARWENRQLGIIHFLRNQTNFDCGTYLNREKALYYKNRINEKFKEKGETLYKLNQSIYYENEWLIPTWNQWSSFDNAIIENPHILELDRLLSLCKDELEAKKNVIKRLYKKLKKDNIKNLKAFKKGNVIQLDFFEKGSYHANENPEYMAYCQEQAFFSLIHDYAKVKALDYAFNLFCDLQKLKEIPKRKPLTLKPNFIDFDYQIKQLYEATKPIFKADIEQWENLFSNEINPFNNPIELRENTTIVTLREFINMLIDCRLISKRGALTTIANSNAFIYDNRLINFNQINDASKTISNEFHDKHEIIDKIKKALKVD